jgi:hypothetical protein
MAVSSSRRALFNSEMTLGFPFIGGFRAHQDHGIFLIATGFLHRIIRSEHDLTDSRSRRCRQAGREHLYLAAFFIEPWNKKS